MTRRWMSPALLVPLLALGACEGLGPDSGNTRVVVSRLGAGGAAFSLSPTAVSLDRRDDDDDRDDDDRRGGNPGAVLALVEDLDVTVTAVQALPAQFLDRPDSGDLWETMTLSGPATVNLLALPDDADNALTLFEGDLPPGAYVRLRFLVSEINLTLAAPLELGGHSFPAGEPIEVALRDPWVRIPGAFFTVADDATSTVDVFFDPGATIGQLVVTNDGQLRFAPVILGNHWRSDRDD